MRYGQTLWKGLEQLCNDFGSTCLGWARGAAWALLPRMSVKGWAVVLCKDCGPQTQPLAFPQLVEQLFLVGEKKYFEQRKDLHSKIMENLGCMFFPNTLYFLSYFYFLSLSRFASMDSLYSLGKESFTVDSGIPMQTGGSWGGAFALLSSTP